MKVLITDQIDRKAKELLEQQGLQVEVRPTLPKDELLSIIPEFSAVAVRSATRLDRELLQRGRRLKVVVRGGVGVDNIDLAAASELGIAVANTPGANTVATAELTLALMLALSRNVCAAQASLARGEWNRGAFRGVELFRKVLGIIGLGRIGRAVAERARAFGMDVMAYDPFLTEQAFVKAGVARVALETIFQRSDFISLHVPLTSKTRAIIDRQAIDQMKPGVRIINCARGGLADENALAEALEQGKIAGVALDVYAKEPPAKNHPLIGHPKVIALPHLGAYTFEAQDKVAEEVAEVITDFLI
ncbi:MAG: phosphoglycerate dehydrogenase, partial [Calditrichaeota bacterium]